MEAKKITDVYDLGTLKSVAKTSGGLVNETKIIETSKGKFVIQKMGNILSPSIVDDYSVIQKHFAGRAKTKIPQLLQTKKGKYVCELEGKPWRVFEYIPSDPVSKETKTIFEVAKLLRETHEVLGKLDYKPKFEIPDFHNTRKIKKKLDGLVSKKNDFDEKIKEKIINAYSVIEKDINKYFLPNHLKKQIIHGDPKLDNFLFKNGKAISLLDWDTLMVGSCFIDLGDGLRSWCRANSKFDQKFFNAAIAGYFGDNPSSKNLNLAKKSLALITLELASRFLIDCFEQSYFKWDQEKYRNPLENHLEKAWSYIIYYEDTKKVLGL